MASARKMQMAKALHDWQTVMAGQQTAMAGQIQTLAQTQSATAVILERINGRLDGIDQWRRSQEDEDKQRPLTNLNTWQTVGILAGAIIGAITIGVMALCSMSSVLVQVVALLLNHLH